MEGPDDEAIEVYRGNAGVIAGLAICGVATSPARLIAIAT